MTSEMQNSEHLLFFFIIHAWTKGIGVLIFGGKGDKTINSSQMTLGLATRKKGKTVVQMMSIL